MAAPLRQTARVEAEDPGERDAILAEVARLELLRRLSIGAAHTLNNAFTAILGETLCLADERKHDPVAAEACTLIQQEVERCARLMRSVATRVSPRDLALDETGLASMLRALEPVLRETVSRAVAIECEAPPVGVCAKGSSEDIELLLLLEAHRLARTARSGASLRIGVDQGAEHLDLVLTLSGEPGDPREPRRDDSAWQELVESALDATARRVGATRLDAAPNERRIRLLRAD